MLLPESLSNEVADSRVALSLYSVGVGSLIVILFAKTVADSEDMTVGVAHVHLSQAPRHVGRRPHDFEPLGQMGVSRFACMDAILSRRRSAVQGFEISEISWSQSLRRRGNKPLISSDRRKR
jgi:hypothetical protein